MGRLIDDMLILTGLENRTRTPSLEPVEPDTFLLNLYEQMEPLALEKGLAHWIDLPDTPLPRFQADPGKLNQVMMIPVSYTHLDVYKRQPLAVTVHTAINMRKAANPAAARCFPFIAHLPFLFIPLNLTK